MKKIFQFVPILILLIPLFTAQAAPGTPNISAIKPYSDAIINVINGVFVPILMAIAFIVFLWGVYKYFIYGAANESEKAEGRMFAMWGIIGFVIIFSLWGIVNILIGTLGLTAGQKTPEPPTFTPPSTSSPAPILQST